MGKLHSRNASLPVDEADDASERLDVFVFPDAEILRADASFGQDGGRFGEDQGCASDGATAEVDEVPVVGESVVAGVFAHGRNEDAVGEVEVADVEGIEQVRHGFYGTACRLIAGLAGAAAGRTDVSPYISEQKNPHFRRWRPEVGQPFRTTILNTSYFILHTSYFLLLFLTRLQGSGGRGRCCRRWTRPTKAHPGPSEH